jgi:serine protease SohB
MVKARRGGKLADDPDLFSGLFWTGTRGRALGLVDGLSDMRTELKRRYGPKTRLELISAPKGLIGRRMPGVGGLSGGMAERIGSGGVSAVADLAEEKALWGRFGLSG